MSKYRKKPVVIEAEVNTPNNFNLVRLLVGNSRPIHLLGDGRITIDTLEGQMTAEVGDYIIMGVEGECYPCKAHIFHKTYEPA